MKESISIYIEKNTIEKVEIYAKKENRSKSNAIESLLKIAFETLEIKNT